MAKKDEMCEIEVDFTAEELKRVKKDARDFGFKSLDKYIVAVALGKVDVEHLRYGRRVTKKSSIRKSKDRTDGFVLPLDPDFVKSCKLREGSTLYCYAYDADKENFMFVTPRKLTQLRVSGKAKMRKK